MNLSAETFCRRGQQWQILHEFSHTAASFFPNFRAGSRVSGWVLSKPIVVGAVPISPVCAGNMTAAAQTDTAADGYGIWDTQGGAWLGQGNGPLVFRDTVLDGRPYTGETIARLKSAIVNEQFGVRTRFRALPYVKTPFRLKDQIAAPIDGKQALEQICQRHQSPTT